MEDSSREKLQGLIIAVLIPLAAFSGDLRIVLAVIAFSMLGVFSLSLVGINGHSIDVVPVSKLVLGFMYIPFMLSHFILLRHIGRRDGVDILYFGLGIFRGYSGILCGEKHREEKTDAPGKSGQDRGGNGRIADRKHCRLRIVPAFFSSGASCLSCSSPWVFGRYCGTTWRSL